MERAQLCVVLSLLCMASRSQVSSLPKPVGGVRYEKTTGVKHGCEQLGSEPWCVNQVVRMHHGVMGSKP